MPQPAFLSGGEEPRRSDTKWLRWCRMLGRVQNSLSGSAANNPRKSDSIWQLKQKLLKALQ